MTEKRKAGKGSKITEREKERVKERKKEFRMNLKKGKWK